MLVEVAGINADLGIFRSFWLGISRFWPSKAALWQIVARKEGGIPSLEVRPGVPGS